MIALLLLLATPAPTVPGVINPVVTQATISTTVCVRGWTATIRPPQSYTSRLKRTQMAAQHLRGPASSYEEDHLISLELGGHPTDPNNLWPQPWTGRANAHQKDRLENMLHRLVCRGTLPLATAQHEIATDWVRSYRARIGGM